MNRRELLSALSGSAVAVIYGCRTPKTGSPRKGGSLEVGRQGRLAGRTLSQLRDRYRYDLLDDFLPFMDKHVIDHELGGFMCNTDRDGTHIDTNKNSWYMGRGIWVYSFLYNHLSRRPEYLEVARKTVEFVLRDQPKGQDLWTAEYTREGTPVVPKGQYIGGKHIPVSKQVYGDLFIAHGLVEYGRCIGGDKYWDMAKALMFKCVEIYDQPDYAPEAPKVYIGADAPPLPGARLLGAWMVLLWLGSQMLTHRPDADIKRVVQRCLGALF